MRTRFPPYSPAVSVSMTIAKSCPRIITTLWEDEGTLCFQVEARGVYVSRREDNDMVNGTKLLNVVGMTRGKRDGILKAERVRHVVRAGTQHLRGVWIPLHRAQMYAYREGIIDLLYPLFINDLKSLLYRPQGPVTSLLERLAVNDKLGDVGDVAGVTRIPLLNTAAGHISDRSTSDSADSTPAGSLSYNPSGGLNLVVELDQKQTSIGTSSSCSARLKSTPATCFIRPSPYSRPLPESTHSYRSSSSLTTNNLSQTSSKPQVMVTNECYSNAVSSLPEAAVPIPPFHDPRGQNQPPTRDITNWCIPAYSYRVHPPPMPPSFHHRANLSLPHYDTATSQYGLFPVTGSSNAQAHYSLTLSSFNTVQGPGAACCTSPQANSSSLRYPQSNPGLIHNFLPTDPNVIQTVRSTHPSSPATYSLSLPMRMPAISSFGASPDSCTAQATVGSPTKNSQTRSLEFVNGPAFAPLKHLCS